MPSLRISHPLDGPRRKVDRARVHIDALDRGVAAFKASDPFSVVFEGHTEDGGNIFRFDVRSQPPPDLGLLVGDIVANLRASLDHLTWQLALANRGGNRPSKRTAFPIYDTPNTYSTGSKDKLKHVGHEAREIIERLQPYHRRIRPEAYWLGLLNELANRDKHQVLNAVHGRAGVRGTDGQVARLDHPMVDGDRLVLQIEPADHDLEFIMIANIGVEADGQIVGSDGLRQIHDFIRDEVIPGFSRLFV